MSCQTCGIVLDCPSDGNPEDITIMTGAYATNPFLVTVDCPAGYYCVPGIFPIVINPGTPPPITFGDGIIFLQSCSGPVIRRITPGMGPLDIQALITQAQQEWARRQALCIVFQGGGGGNPNIPPPTRIPSTPAGGRVDVNNTEQCFTAYCPDLTNATRCTAANTVGVTLFNPTPEQIAQTQAEVNQLALSGAQTAAQKALACGICNSALHYFAACPGDPSKVADVDIPAAKYCVATGTPNGQDIVDAKANVDANNQASSILTGQGCACTITVTGGGGPGVINSPCHLCGTWNLNSPFFICIGPGAFDPEAQFEFWNGSSYHIHGNSILNIAGYRIVQYYP